METTSIPRVYTAIAEVMGDLAKEGISKSRKNQQQGYQFRGIDDVYNALSPILARHKLTVLPRMLDRNVVERETRNGGVLFYVTVRAEFDFVCAEDGSKHTVGPMYGEAMDSGDKATNKAMSAAYKYAAMQAFCIPTEGDNDADSSTHEVKPGIRVAPHPEGTDQQDPEIVEQYADALRTYMNGNDPDRVYNLHVELNRDQPLYAAVGAKLNTKEKNRLREIVASRRVAA